MGLEGGGVDSLASRAAFTLAGSAFFFFLVTRKGEEDEAEVVRTFKSSGIPW